MVYRRSSILRLYSNTGFYAAGPIWTASSLNPAGAVNFAANTWNTSSDGYQRLYFGASGITYIKSVSNIVFRTNNVDNDTTFH
jgi:hypothetical protein